MSRKGENIYKRKDGRWEGRYIKGRSVENKAVYGYIYGKTYKYVKTELVKRQAEIEKSFENIKNDDILFSVLVEIWREAHNKCLKESTQVKYRNLLNSYILPTFSELMVSQITNDVVFCYSNCLLTTGGRAKKGLSSKTVSDILTLIKNILRFASRKGYKVKYIADVIPIKQTYTQLRILTLQEQECLCQYLYSKSCLENIGILLCLFTGIRVGELCALKWENISISEKTIYINKTMQRIQLDYENTEKTKILISTPKSNSSIRTIPLPECIQKDIIKYKNSQDTFFLTGRRDKFIEPRTMQNRFKTVLKECQINSVNFHALRHTFATRCVELGFDIKSLSEILGHANVNITLNRYVHSSIELKRDNMSKLNNLFAVK